MYGTPLQFSRIARRVLAATLGLLTSAAVHGAQAQVCPDHSPSASRSKISVMDFGAVGDGRADDTSHIQSAVDKASQSGGSVVIPDGTYMIDARRGVELRDNVSLRLSQKAILKAIPNGEIRYNVLRVVGVSNVTIEGGSIVGDRDDHSSTEGQWGMGIRIGNSTGVLIQNTLLRDMWGDGAYVYGQSKDIKFCGVTADNNRRQGLSIIAVDGLSVKNSTFSNTNGVGPQSGIDIEPNEGDHVINVSIEDSKFLNNQGHGIVMVVTAKLKQASISKVLVTNNVVMGNRKVGVGVYNSYDNQVTGNTFDKNGGADILLHRTSRDNLVSQNRVSKTNAIQDQAKNRVNNN